MRDIIKKMCDQVPHRLLWLNIFLPALMAITAMQSRTAVQTNFFASFFGMRQGRNFVKNKEIKVQGIRQGARIQIQSPKLIGAFPCPFFHILNNPFFRLWVEF